METKVLALLLAILFGAISYCHACSCMMMHPQEHYCKSDFVILARVKKEQIVKSTSSIVYKVRVRKEFKISEKGLVALKSGRLHTPQHDMSCGIRLRVGTLYVISGRIQSLKATVMLCNMVKEWKTVTKRQRKGLKLMYKRGCDCTVCRKPMCNHHAPRDNCIWRNLDCESENGICLRQAHGSCMWNRNKMLTSCYAAQHQPQRNSSILVPHHRYTPPRLPLEP